MKSITFNPSLRGRIVLAYVTIAFLTLVLAVFAYGELRLLQDRIHLGERVTELYDTAMEIRRFERNFFLHAGDADYRENAAYCEKLARLLERNREDFVTLGLGGTIPTLQAEIETYRHLMDEYVVAGDNGNDRQRRLEPRIRAAGKAIVAASESVVAAERQAVRTSLSSFQTMLFVSFAVVAVLMMVVGHKLARRVVQPLKQIENSVNAVASGRLRELAMPGEDREIVSIVTAFNQMLHELELRRKHLLRSEKLASMGTMVSGVAHELNNPLSNIWSSCQIMLEDPTLAADDAKRELLRQIDEQSVRARNIVRSLLDFTRDRQFHKSPVALDELVRQSLRFLKADIPAGLAVEVNVPAGLVLPADPQRLQQALLNLVKNAAEAAGPTGHIAISASAQPAASSNGLAGLEACRGAPSIEIRVSDSGPGIPADVRPRIFDPFFTTKPVGKGMGLGLFIVDQIVEEHGGCIALDEQRSGQGATFVLRLPTEDRREHA